MKFLRNQNSTKKATEKFKKILFLATMKRKFDEIKKEIVMISKEEFFALKENPRIKDLEMRMAATLKKLKLQPLLLSHDAVGFVTPDMRYLSSTYLHIRNWDGAFGQYNSARIDIIGLELEKIPGTKWNAYKYYGVQTLHRFSRDGDNQGDFKFLETNLKLREMYKYGKTHSRFICRYYDGGAPHFLQKMAENLKSLNFGNLEIIRENSDVVATMTDRDNGKKLKILFHDDYKGTVEVDGVVVAEAVGTGDLYIMCENRDWLKNQFSP